MIEGSPLQEAVSPPAPDADWDALIRTHERAVLLALFARGVRPTRARELAADAWSGLYESWRHGRLPVLELPGLVIAHAALLERREGRTAGRAAPLEQALQAVDLSASPERRAEGRQQLRRVEEALDHCSPRARELFAASYQHPELPQAVLARRLGVSLQRFRQTLCEVRARLRTALEDGE